jgi:phosphoglycerate dehydrogenase-like enzyme
MLRVYVENKAGRADTYRITEEIFRGAVPLPQEALALTVKESDQPDLDALAGADVFVGSGFDVNRIRLHAPRLKLVHCTSAGVELYLPLDWLPPGAQLTNSSGIHAAKASEYATMALLMLNTGMPRFQAGQREHRWAPRRTGAIAGKRLLVVGLGRLGAAVASAGSALGLRVRGVTRHGRPVVGVTEVFRAELLPDQAQHCEFLALCCPLTDETRGLINAEVLARMPRGAGLVNMARGPVIVTNDLLDALSRGHLAGAVLDVFDTEPLGPDSPLWDAPNVIVTPHISCDVPTGYTAKSLAILARNLERLLAGRDDFENRVSADLGY